MNKGTLLNKPDEPDVYGVCVREYKVYVVTLDASGARARAYTKLHIYLAYLAY